MFLDPLIYCHHHPVTSKLRLEEDKLGSRGELRRMGKTCMLKDPEVTFALA